MSCTSMQIEEFLPRLALAVVVGTSVFIFLVAVVKIVITRREAPPHCTIDTLAKCAQESRHRVIQFTNTALLYSHQPIATSPFYFEIHILTLPPNASLLVGVGPRTTSIGKNATHCSDR